MIEYYSVLTRSELSIPGKTRNKFKDNMKRLHIMILITCYSRKTIKIIKSLVGAKNFGGRKMNRLAWRTFMAMTCFI